MVKLYKFLLYKMSEAVTQSLYDGVAQCHGLGFVTLGAFHCFYMHSVIFLRRSPVGGISHTSNNGVWSSPSKCSTAWDEVCHLRFTCVVEAAMSTTTAFHSTVVVNGDGINLRSSSSLMLKSTDVELSFCCSV